MVVYLDLVMGLNFAVDLMLILGTNRLSGFPPGLGRSAAAAALGAAYAGGCMLPGMTFLGNLLWRVVFLCLMGMIAFGWNRGAWKRTGVFILLSMAMGGMAIAMGRDDFPVLILSAAVICLLCRLGFGGQVGGRQYMPITVTEGDSSASVLALMDTGNTLRDPLTGEQVIILGPGEAEKLLHMTRAQLQNPLQTMLAQPGRGFRLIPYQSVGQPAGLLLAKRFSRVKLGQQNTKAVIAFSPEEIGKGEGYQALMGGNA